MVNYPGYIGRHIRCSVFLEAHWKSIFVIAEDELLLREEPSDALVNFTL